MIEVINFRLSNLKSRGSHKPFPPYTPLNLTIFFLKEKTKRKENILSFNFMWHCLGN